MRSYASGDKGGKIDLESFLCSFDGSYVSTRATTDDDNIVFLA